MVRCYCIVKSPFPGPGKNAVHPKMNRVFFLYRAAHSVHTFKNDTFPVPANNPPT